MGTTQEARWGNSWLSLAFGPGLRLGMGWVDGGPGEMLRSFASAQRAKNRARRGPGCAQDDGVDKRVEWAASIPP